jgi:transposase-like protein
LFKVIYFFLNVLFNGESPKTFQLKFEKKAYQPGIKNQIIEMSFNGSGIRDITRVLGIDTNTVTATLKK